MIRRCGSKASTTSRRSPATRRGTSTSTPRVLGLRLVAKTVNQDDPSVYHLFYADEHGPPGRGPDLLRVPARRARAARAPGWCTAIVSRVGAPRRRWPSGRSASAPRASRTSAWATACASPIPRASGTSCACAPAATRRWSPSTPRSRAELALQGFDGVRAYSRAPSAAAIAARAAARRRRALGDDTWELRGERPRRHHRLRRSRRRARPARAPARSITSRGARPSPSTRAGSTGSARRRRAHVGDRRPPLLPLDLLPRAERRPVRDRRRRPGLHASTATASRSWARRSSCRRWLEPQRGRDRGDPHAAARPAR